MSRLSKKQKRALEKITGKAWDAWNADAVSAYFTFTDRGQKVEVKPEAIADFNKLMAQHHWHSAIVEMWKKDFKAGLLFLDDFLKGDHPEAYVQHAFEIYQETMGYIPLRYRGAGSGAILQG